VPAVVNSDSNFAQPEREALVEPEPELAPETPLYQALLDDARAARDAGNFIEPAGDNAIELYLQVLEEVPEDPIIGAEFDAVVDRVLGMAETAILEQNAEDADNALAIVRLADPDNPRITFLGAQLAQLELRALVDETRLAIRDGHFEEAGRLISEARSLAGTDSAEVNLVSQELSAARVQQEVNAMLVTANERLEAGDLVAPSKDNARYYFVLALTSDPENQAAQHGLTIVASKLALQAREAIDDGRFGEARVLLRDAETLDPANSELAASANSLETAIEAKAEAERQAAAAAEAARLAELERQAELARQAEVARLAELERQAELARQAEVARLAELERQAELDRKAEIARQEELQRQAELERQAEIERMEELDRQAEAARLAEIRRQAEAERQAAAREARRIASEKNAAAAATASALGVAGSAVKEAGSSSSPTVTAPRKSNNDAPPAVAASATTAPRSTASTNVGATGGAKTFAVGDVTNSSTLRTDSSQAAVPSSPPQSISTGNRVVDTLASGNINGSAGDNMVPISVLTRTNYVAPVYPRAALRRSLTGSVEVMFTVSTIGMVTDISVLRAEPEETFNQAAMDAVAEWQFQPVIENGVAVEKRSAVRLAFDLE
jgi:TonB family protein